MRKTVVFLCLMAAPATADEKKPPTLTPKEIADGWIMLFDGESTFGWKVEGEAKVEAGVLTLVGGEKGASLSSVHRHVDFSPSSRRLVARLAPNLHWMAATPALQQFLGRPLAELTAHSFLDTVHPDDVPQLTRTFQDALRDGEGHNITFRVLTPASFARKPEANASGDPSSTIADGRSPKSFIPANSPFWACVPPGEKRLATARSSFFPTTAAIAAATMIGAVLARRIESSTAGRSDDQTLLQINGAIQGECSRSHHSSLTGLSPNISFSRRAVPADVSAGGDFGSTNRISAISPRAVASPCRQSIRPAALLNTWVGPML